MIGRCKHHEVLERAVPETARAVVALDPMAHDRSPCGVRDAGELRDHAVGARQIPQGPVEATCNVIDGHLVSEADLLSEMKIADVQGQVVAGRGGAERAWEFTVGIGVRDTPTVYEDQAHGFTPFLVSCAYVNDCTSNGIGNNSASE